MRISLFFIFFIGNMLFAQEAIHKCYTDEHLDYLELNHPGIKENVANLFEAAKLHSQNFNKPKIGNNVYDTIYRIPVVFHVVHKLSNSDENVSESLLQSQIDVLNEDFNRMNADTSNTRAIFKDRAAGVGFEFFLATIDPEGNPTNGITRTETTTTFNFFDLDAMKNPGTGKEAWNTNEYLNIWVCDLGGFILGFAYPPAAAPNWPTGQTPSSPNYEGVVIDYQVIGYNNPLAVGQLSIANKGRTAVHEVGHYWGLRHIWGDSGSPFSTAPDCDLTKDDGFDDTPHMGNNSQTTGCSFSKNSCTNGESPDEPDMIENYMDYSTESCQNMFSAQQANLMRSMAVIGRPNVSHEIIDELIVLEVGDWIVVNGTDTFLLDGNSNVNINTGDEVMFLNANNGFNYTSSGNFTIDANDEAMVTEQGALSFNSNPNTIESAMLSLIKIFPNPSKDYVQVSNPSGIEIHKIKVISLTGQVIFEQEIGNQHIATIATSAMSNGIYFLQVENQSQVLGVKKLTVLH